MGEYMAIECKLNAAVCCFYVIRAVMRGLYVAYSSSAMGHAYVQ